MKHQHYWIDALCQQMKADGDPCLKPITVLGDMFGAPLREPDCGKHVKEIYAKHLAETKPEGGPE